MRVESRLHHGRPKIGNRSLIFWVSSINETMDPEFSGTYRTSLSVCLLPCGSTNMTDPVSCADTHFPPSPLMVSKLSNLWSFSKRFLKGVMFIFDAESTIHSYWSSGDVETWCIDGVYLVTSAFQSYATFPWFSDFLELPETWSLEESEAQFKHRIPQTRRPKRPILLKIWQGTASINLHYLLLL